MVLGGTFILTYIACPDFCKTYNNKIGLLSRAFRELVTGEVRSAQRVPRYIDCYVHPQSKVRADVAELPVTNVCYIRGWYVSHSQGYGPIRGDTVVFCVNSDGLSVFADLSACKDG